ncbi:MAG: YihY/virulence factor BrkB family protein [Kiritimatiellia bacterium]
MAGKGLGRIGAFIKEDLWGVDVDSLPGTKRQGLQLLRFFSVTLRGFVGHRCSLHAAGLTCFSILSVIPVLLLMLLLTKPCGMYDWAREKLRVRTDQMIETFFEPKEVVAPAVAQPPAANGAGQSFAQQARDLRNQILKQIDEKIENFNFGLVTLVSFATLVWTVVSMAGQVESSFNEIWRVEVNRSLPRRACLYVGTLMVLPLLSALAMSLPVLRLVKASLDATLGATAYTKWAGDALVALLDSSLFSYAVTFAFASLALAFLFKAMPNCPVSLRAACEGGLVTAVLLGGWLRACAFVQFGLSNAGAAYGSFALIPILIVWISMSWKIILLGSNMTYAFQCVHSRVRDLPRG